MAVLFVFHVRFKYWNKSVDKNINSEINLFARSVWKAIERKCEKKTQFIENSIESVSGVIPQIQLDTRKLITDELNKRSPLI